MRRLLLVVALLACCRGLPQPREDFPVPPDAEVGQLSVGPALGLQRSQVSQCCHAQGAEREWSLQLAGLWAQLSTHISFCLGSRQSGVLKARCPATRPCGCSGLCGACSPLHISAAVQVARESFPWPLPSGPAEDAVCSNSTRIGQALCGPDSISTYYKVVLLLEDARCTEAVHLTSTHSELPAVLLRHHTCVPPLTNPSPQYLLLTNDQEKVPNTQDCPDGQASDECSPGFFDATGAHSEFACGGS